MCLQYFRMLGLILECLKSISETKSIRKLKQNCNFKEERSNSHMIKQRKSELFLQLFLEAFPTNQELPHRSYKESLVLQTTMKMIH